ncbi:DUF4124 domain-containing protein [Nitrococcus mobilis]|uniref:DUF4124 domain-containing protein n=1 Tax=Nitrococcus mobilis Nb-231 TaxID=314278 RepID=A4BU18_9GAMM|nr:DUF4124 domain-containing protein [Nitrococcus mobilis]EAR20839.1 hypothetical protein NB231_11199 [Nitrococcus mobilis Nb-231]
MIIRGMLLLVFGLWLASAAAAGPVRFYKWVDAQGRVHYSDTVPPAAAGQQREVKSSSGQTLQTIEPPPTRQQLEAEQRAHEMARQAERRRRVQEEYDKTLLLTFSSVQEIKAARDDRLQAITAQIKLIQERLDKLERRLQVQRRRAVRIERTGQRDPTPVYAEILQLQRHIDENDVFIERKLQERERIRQEFARDLARYRELMAAEGRREAPERLDKP